MLTLQNFEDEIDSTILNRGFDYFRQKMVSKLTNSEGDILATVHGTNLYQVKMKVAGKGILDSHCDCPYKGDYCKHEVAVFYALSRDEIPAVQTDPDKALEKLSKKELVSLVKKGRFESADFEEFYQVESSLRQTNLKKDDFKKIIRQSVNSAKDHHGFIDWNSAYRASRGADRLLDEAESLPVSSALDIYQSVIEVMVPVLQHADDSDGAIGESIEFSFEKIEALSNKIKDKGSKNDLFNYCLTESKKKKYNGWSFSFRFLEIAGNVCSREQKEKLFSILDGTINQSDKFSREYDEEISAGIKYKLIKRLDNESDLARFINHNLRHDNIRQIAIASAMEEHDYREAKALAQQGADKYKKDAPGIREDYLKLLLEIAEIGKDLHSQKNLLFELFSINPNKEFVYFKKLKKISVDSDWPQIFKKVIKKIDNIFDLAEVYNKEKMYPQLLAIVKKDDDSYLAEEYFNKLYEKYPEELAKVYEKTIYNKMEFAAGRGLYREVCKFLERIIFLGQKRRADKIMEKLIQKYPQRKAMIEELESIRVQGHK